MQGTSTPATPTGSARRPPDRYRTSAPTHPTEPGPARPTRSAPQRHTFDPTRVSQIPVGLCGPLPAWARQKGLSPAELEALRHAGFTEDRMDDWPLPEHAARTWQALPSAPGCGMPAPLGMTEVNRRIAHGGTQHLWFMPIHNEQDLQRLRQGLFLMALAQALGMPGAAPAVHAACERTGQGLTYGMLIPFDPDALPAIDAGLNPLLHEHIGQCVALDWLGFLIGRPLAPADLVWIPQDSGHRLCPRLPLDGPVAPSKQAGPEPVLPDVIDRTLLDRLEQIDCDRWAREASRALGPQAAAAFVRRLDMARDDLGNRVAVREATTDWTSPEIRRDLGTDRTWTRLEGVRTGQLGALQARECSRHDSLALRIPLEQGLARCHESRDPKGVPPRRTAQDVEPLSRPEDYPVRSALRLYERALDQPLQGAARGLHETRALNKELVRFLDKAQATAAEHGSALPDHLIRLRQQVKSESPLIDQALSLHSALVMRGAPSPVDGWSPRRLMDLAACGARVDTVAPALHCGATGQEIRDAHLRGLSPSWPLLGQALLQAGARQHHTTAQALRPGTSRAQLAEAMQQVRDRQVNAPTPTRLGTRMGPAERDSPTVSFAHELLLHTSLLWLDGGRMGRAVQTARAFDRADATLATTDLRDAALLEERRQNALTALALLHAELNTLWRALDPSETQACDMLRALQTRLAGRQTQLAALKAHAQAVGLRLPPGLPRHPHAGDLLNLTAAGGPDLDYAVHGLLLGWEGHDILAAHAARWPAWVMEWGSGFADAQTRLDLARASVNPILQRIAKPF